MDDEEVTVKDIVNVNKIRKVEDKLLFVIEEEKVQLSKSEEYKGESNVILLNGVFNILTTIVTSDIDDGIFGNCKPYYLSLILSAYYKSDGYIL